MSSLAGECCQIGLHGMVMDRDVPASLKLLDGRSWLLSISMLLWC